MISKISHEDLIERNFISDAKNSYISVLDYKYSPQSLPQIIEYLFTQSMQKTFIHFLIIFKEKYQYFRII